MSAPTVEVTWDGTAQRDEYRAILAWLFGTDAEPTGGAQ